MLKDEAVVLDTHVLIWLMLGDSRLSTSRGRKMIEKAQEANRIFLPAIAIWEIGMLESKGRISFNRPCLDWIQEALSAPGIRLAPLSPEISIESSRLPGLFHGDPADRMIVATARVLDAVLITADAKILAYGELGHARVHGV